MRVGFEERNVRGGSWQYKAGNCRTAFRIGDSPNNAGMGVGFRLVAGQEREDEKPQSTERA